MREEVQGEGRERLSRGVASGGGGENHGEGKGKERKTERDR